MLNSMKEFMIGTTKGRKEKELEKKGTKALTLKHFPVSDEDSFVQYTIRMSEAEY